MPRISEQKKQKISEHILSLLFDSFPKPLFTSEIARETARDEEFIKSILHELNNKSIVSLINKNTKGINYIRRQRWRLSNKTHEIYSKKVK